MSMDHLAVWLLIGTALLVQQAAITLRDPVRGYTPAVADSPAWEGLLLTAFIVLLWPVATMALLVGVNVEASDQEAS